MHGLGVKKSWAKAKLNYEAAARKGVARACYNLGLMYSSGEGVRLNDKTAERYYLKAISLNHTMAQVELAFLYLDEQSPCFAPKKAKALVRGILRKKIMSEAKFKKLFKARY